MHSFWCIWLVRINLTRNNPVMHHDSAYCNESNNSNHSLFIVFQVFEHPRLKSLFQYPNTYTLRSSNGGHQTPTSLQQSLQSYSKSYQTSSSTLQVSTRLLQLFSRPYCHCRTWIGVSLRQSLQSSNGVAKHVLVFDSLCGAWTGG